MTNKFILLLHLLGAFNMLFAKTYETDDAIIVEGKCESISLFPFIYSRK